ncbi:MAG: hypothetical protein ACRDS9_16590 [Pseudonocardiaceae bacterium]
MTFWNRNRNDDGDADLDQWIKSGLDVELTQMDAAFDFEAGLADAYARAGLTRPEAAEPHSHTATDPSIDITQDTVGQGAVQAVVDHIEMLDALLGAVTKSDQETSPITGVIYLTTARQFLLQLRIGLTGRRLTQARASQLVDTIEHDLRETDKILRGQQGLSLQDAVHARIGELRDVGGDLIDQVQRLREKVLRLFTDVDETASRLPVPHN